MPATSEVRSTEVISMGVQEMYDDPITFGEIDSDYFDFMVDTPGLGGR